MAVTQDLLERMARNGADFTLTFRRLCTRRPGRTAPRLCAAYCKIPASAIERRDGAAGLPKQEQKKTSGHTLHCRSMTDHG